MKMKKTSVLSKIRTLSEWDQRKTSKVKKKSRTKVKPRLRWISGSRAKLENSELKETGKTSPNSAWSSTSRSFFFLPWCGQSISVLDLQERTNQTTTMKIIHSLFFAPKFSVPFCFTCRCNPVWTMPLRDFSTSRTILTNLTQSSCHISFVSWSSLSISWQKSFASPLLLRSTLHMTSWWTILLSVASQAWTSSSSPPSDLLWRSRWKKKRTQCQSKTSTALLIGRSSTSSTNSCSLFWSLFKFCTRRFTSISSTMVSSCSSSLEKGSAT